MKKINKLTIFTYIILLSYLLLIILNGFKIINFSLSFKPIILFFVCCVIKVFSRKEYLRSRDNIENVKNVIFYLGKILLIYFLTGIVFGYSYNAYSYELISILKNIFNFVIIYIFIEYIRFYLISHSGNKKILFIFIAIFFTLYDINYSSFINSFNNNKNVFIYIFSNLMPVITKNIAVSYIFYKYGFYSSMAYQILYSIFSLFIPILPSFNHYLKFISFIIIPVYVCVNINKPSVVIVSKENKKNGLYSFLIISLAIFISCFNFRLFKYAPIAIASNSMKPEFKKGSLVIYEKVNENEVLKEKNIIVFKYGNDIYIHRIIKVSKNNDNYFYTTKGDANTLNDKNKTISKDVLGKVILDIPYLGYPSVWFENIIN